MIKHIGRHNNDKVILVFRQLPSPQEHMALVLYTGRLGAAYHDSMMKVLESNAGQTSNDFADVLHRNLFPDGRNMLNALHHEGWLKKVPTSQVIVEANAKSHIRLDELNNIINEMATGAEAQKRLEDLDTSSGLQTAPQKNIPQERISAMDMAAAADLGIADQNPVDEVVVDEAMAGDGVLSDVDIAQNTINQAAQMEAEATRLREEAYAMAPSLKPTTKTAAKRKKVA